MLKKRCVIICAYIHGRTHEAAKLYDTDFIICADGGYAIAKADGISPDVVIGDFDSSKKLDFPCETITLPCEKDDTDTMSCVRHGLKLGFREFLILGGIGGRLDHTIANLQTLSFALDNGAAATLADSRTHVSIFQNGALTVARREGWRMGVFAYSAECTGVYIRGAKYPLDDATLTASFPIGVSNEFLDGDAVVSVRHGRLLLILTHEENSKN